MISAVRDTKIPRTKPRIALKRSLKHFVEQAFLHDLSHFNWDRILLIDDLILHGNIFMIVLVILWTNMLLFVGSG